MKDPYGYEFYTYRAKVVRIVDGDTLDAEVDLGFYCSARVRFRLLGVDTPEIYGRTTPEEREAGKRASNFVKTTLPVGSDILLVTDKTGKYGRWLATVYYPVNDVDVSDGVPPGHRVFLFTKVGKPDRMVVYRSLNCELVEKGFAAQIGEMRDMVR